MGEVINRELIFEVARFVNTQNAALKLYGGIPHCKAIRDFLALKQKSSIAALEVGEKAELHVRLAAIVDTLRHESKQLLVQFQVEREADLSADARKFYDARIKAVVEREDHYP